MKVLANVKIQDAHSLDVLWEGHNITVAGGLDLALFLLFGDSDYSGLTYCAVGTSASTPSSGDMTLGTEVSRHQFTSDVVISTGTASIQTYFPASECSVNIKELGLFGNGASNTANSGTLFAHVSTSYDNTSLAKDIVITWSITLESA